MLQADLFIRNLFFCSTCNLLKFKRNNITNLISYIDNQIHIMCSPSRTQTNVNLLLNIMPSKTQKVLTKVFKILAGFVSVAGGVSCHLVGLLMNQL